ncbi:MAG: hypothetical protein ACJAXE_002329, partial [Neolewinella sp.]
KVQLRKELLINRDSGLLHLCAVTLFLLGLVARTRDAKRVNGFAPCGSYPIDNELVALLELARGNG